jgi:hypothetical protein
VNIRERLPGISVDGIIVIVGGVHMVIITGKQIGIYTRMIRSG